MVFTIDGVLLVDAGCCEEYRGKEEYKTVPLI